MKELVAHLQANNDNHAVLRLKLVIGPISVSPGPARLQIALTAELTTNLETKKTS